VYWRPVLHTYPDQQRRDSTITPNARLGVALPEREPLREHVKPALRGVAAVDALRARLEVAVALEPRERPHPRAGRALGVERVEERAERARGLLEEADVAERDRSRRPQRERN
jgi:hypothetical protein